MFKKTSRSGFTLVEIILVIGMIGVILGGLIAVIDPAAQFRKGKDSQRKADIKAIQNALELFRADNGSYPTWVTHVGGGWATANTMNLNMGGVTYLRTIPEGPGDYPDSGSANVGNCDYIYSSGGSVYTIYTVLENKSDKDALAIKPDPAYRPSGFNTNNITATWTSGSCQRPATGPYNYWVNSP